MGLPDLARVVDLAAKGGATIEDVRAAAGAVKGRGACSHPDGTSRFAVSALEVFTEDLAAHTSGDGCGKRVKGVLPIPKVLDTGGGVHSVFASAFLEALETNSQILSTPELFSRIEKRVQAAAASNKFVQTPEFKSIKGAGHELGDFFFVPRG